MAKTYINQGSVCKRKDGGLMLKINCDSVTFTNNGQEVTLKKGEYMEVETVASQTEKYNYLLSNDKISQEIYDKQMERVNNTPDFVLAGLTAVK